MVIEICSGFDVNLILTDVEIEDMSCISIWKLFQIWIESNRLSKRDYHFSAMYPE